MRTHSRHGFTLIELLVVVSIIALLISILLPSVQAVRQQARIAQCASNMKQHALGVELYGTSNNSFFPHAPMTPRGTAGQNNPFGRQGNVAQFYGNREFPSSGFSFASSPQNSVTALRGTGNNEISLEWADGGFRITWRNLQMTDAYWTVLGEVMTDGEGISALNSGVFISPSDTQSREDLEFLNKDLQDREGRWFDMRANGNDYDVFSYRYVSACLVDPALYTWTSSGPAVGPGVNVANLSLANRETYYRYVRRINQADCRFPSSKVTFFMYFAHHDPNIESWVMNGARIPVALADGSARVVEPYRDGYAREAPGGLFGDWSENAGPYFTYNLDFGFGSTPHPAHFLATYGGIRGRDL